MIEKIKFPEKFESSKIEIRIMGPNLSRVKYASSDNKRCQTLLPSRGGMGSRLNTARTTFIRINSSRNAAWGNTFKIRAHKIAKIKFEIGPERAVKKLSLAGFLKLWMLTCTGFAHPKAGNPENARKIGTTTVPTRSI